MKTRELIIGAMATTFLNATSAAAQTASARPATPPTGDVPSPPVSTPQPASVNQQQPNVTQKGLEEIVVTAQRRSENLQRVPISVTAVTLQAMRANSIDATLQLQKAAPGLITLRTGASLQPFIRGVGSNLTAQGTENSVAIYIDGVYQGFKAGNLFEFNDIERIEVLKGPQGTLFGRNSSGGAISIITRDPSRDQGVEGEFGYGNLNEKRAKVYAAGNVMDGLSASVAYSGRWNDGYIKDPTRANVSVSPYRTQSVMGKLKWAPTADFRSTLSAGYSTLDDATATATHILPGTLSTPAVTGFPAPQGNDQSATSVPTPLNRSQSARVTWDNRFALGKLDLVSITGYIHNKLQNATDNDASPANLQLIRTNQFSHTFSQEFQVQSNKSDRFTWIAGVYFLSFKDFYGNPGQNWSVQSNVPYFVRPADLLVPGASIIGRTTGVQTTSYSGFAEGKYTIFEGTHVTIGGRYTSDEKHLTGTQYAYKAVAATPATAGQLNCALPNGVLGNDNLVFGCTTNGTVDLDKTFKKFTWRAVLDHQFAPDVLGYASVSTGFKSGGFNPSVVSNNQIVINPETVTNYEVGFKSQFFQGRLRANGSLFYNDFKNIQVALIVASGSSITQNAGAARTFGADFEVDAIPVPNLTLHAGMEYLDSKYTEFANAALTLPRVTGFTCVPGTNLTYAQALQIASMPQTGGNCASLSLNAKGLPTIFSPKFTANLGATYDVFMTGGSKISLTAGYYHNSGFDFNPGGIFTHSGPINSLSASLTWTAPSRRYYVRIWGDNLTNDRYPRTILPSAFAYWTTTSQPITYGALVGFKF